jgi:hypothetical protein
MGGAEKRENLKWLAKTKETYTTLFEVEVSDKWQRSTPVVYYDDKKLHLQGCPCKLSH